MPRARVLLIVVCLLPPDSAAATLRRQAELMSLPPSPSFLDGCFIADAVKRLETAIAAGFPVTGEPRFVSRDGEPDFRSPQELLPAAMSCPPRYDCDKGTPVGQ
jgi:hypothetical protein